MENIGKKLQTIRELHNYTQAYVASKIGISQAAYAKIEQKSHISLDILKKIAEEVYGGVSVDKIMSLPRDPKIIINNIYDNNGVIINISGNITFNPTFSKKEVEQINQELQELKERFECLIKKIIT